MKESTIQGLDEQEEEEITGLHFGEGLDVVNIGSHHLLYA